MTQIRFEMYEPTPEDRFIGIQDVDEVFRALPTDASVTFTWNDGADDEVLIVALGEGFSTVTMLRDGTFYDLKASDREGYREVNTGGQWSEHPEEFLMERQQGIEVLKQAEDFDELHRKYVWVGQ